MTNIKTAFTLALIYVVLGTFYSYYAIDNMITGGIIYYFFSPVSFFPQFILFADGKASNLVLICQVVTLVILTLIIFGVIRLLRKGNEINQ